MKRSVNLESLKAERKALSEELQVLDRLIAIHERRQRASGAPGNYKRNTVPPPISIRSQIVTTVYNLVHENGGPVTSDQIFERVERLGILEGKKNKRATRAAILDQVTKMKKLERIDRGVYDILSQQQKRQPS